MQLTIPLIFVSSAGCSILYCVLEHFNGVSVLACARRSAAQLGAEASLPLTAPLAIQPSPALPSLASSSAAVRAKVPAAGAGAGACATTTAVFMTPVTFDFPPSPAAAPSSSFEVAASAAATSASPATPTVHWAKVPREFSAPPNAQSTVIGGGGSASRQHPKRLTVSLKKGAAGPSDHQGPRLTVNDALAILCQGIAVPGSLPNKERIPASSALSPAVVGSTSAGPLSVNGSPGAAVSASLRTPAQHSPPAVPRSTASRPKAVSVLMARQRTSAVPPASVPCASIDGACTSVAAAGSTAEPASQEPKAIALPGDDTVLHRMVTSYLRDQHRRCGHPSTTLPPLPLLHPHSCPTVKAGGVANNLVSRLVKQQV